MVLSWLVMSGRMSLEQGLVTTVLKEERYLDLDATTDALERAGVGVAGGAMCDVMRE